MRSASHPAFTLIELLIVVGILGILAAIAVVKTDSAVTQTKKAVLKSTLSEVQRQVQVFRMKHCIPAGVDPETGAESAETFLAQMTRYVDEDGRTSASRSGGYLYGPYFADFPHNPINKRDTVLIVGDGEPLPAADNSTGWIYKPETGEFYANVPDYGPGSAWMQEAVALK